MDKKEEFSQKCLLQIGDVAKCCGINRQTILFYERQGLLQATEQNDTSGYRYYSTAAVTKLMQILQLRDAGLSIREIKEYMCHGVQMAQKIMDSMEKKLADLLEGIDLVRALSVAKDDYTVRPSQQVAMTCYVREYTCRGIDEAMAHMYATFYEALAKGIRVRESYRIYAEYPDETGDDVQLTDFRMRVCIPVDPGTTDPACLLFPATSGISVCHRGEYGDIGKAYTALWDFVRQHNLHPAGPVRECYLEGSREHENDTNRYLTKLMLPIAGTGEYLLPMGQK
ncbi:MAG: MerR family transcriptional regulator [Eubacteriales bacterium]